VAALSVGVATFISVGRPENPVLAPGELIKLDCGVVIDGYLSDGGRIFVCSQPSSDQQRVYDLLLEAHERVRAAMRPGVTLGELHRVAAASIHAGGLTGYSRGNFGHSIGLDDFGEAPPFIAAGELTRLEPGMAFCLEVPYYATCLGGFQVEDMYVVTEEGVEQLGSLPFGLTVV